MQQPGQKGATVEAAPYEDWMSPALSVMQEDGDTASSGGGTGADLKGGKRKRVGGHQMGTKQKRSTTMAPPPARLAAGRGAKELLLAKMKSLMQQALAAESATEKRRLLSEIKVLQLGTKEKTAQQTEPKPGHEKGAVKETDTSTPDKTDVEAEVDS
eukprot:COSAG02_NODE_8293_length_2628_cov_109.831554_2_plen_157_part_00